MGDNIVVVAIPDEYDRVWEVSSEKVPHLTILYMGPSSDQGIITQFVLQAAKMTLTKFDLDVDRRGVLGPDKADVVFFKDNDDLDPLKTFRALMLREPHIKAAFDSVPQFGDTPHDWSPHLTMGYPETPAKQELEYPIDYVWFDRIAIWTGDYSGPTLELDDPTYYDADDPLPIPEEVSMSDSTAVKGRKFIRHHGVLGMKWGHRKGESASPVTSKSGTSIRGKAKPETSGGEHHPAHKDALEVAGHIQKMKKSGLAALSNHELNTVQQRLQLEANVSRLHAETKGSGAKFVKGLFTTQAKNVANRAASDATNEAYNKAKASKS